jgi:hypothetical protein
LDHVKPKSKGGSYHLSNLKAAHSICNQIRGKGNKKWNIRKRCLSEIGKLIGDGCEARPLQSTANEKAEGSAKEK